MSGYVPVARGAENTLEYRLFYQNAAGEAIRWESHRETINQV